MLYDSSVADVDEFAELFDSEVERILDIHASCQTKRDGPSSAVVDWNVGIDALV